MDKTQFWQLIEASQNQRGDCDKQAAKLQKSLSKLTAEEILGFRRVFDECVDLAYRWDLWGVAYIINGGASDDAFEYFRWWLIAQGREYFETALENPESAGDKAKFEEAGCEAIAYCINDAYQEKTGHDLPVRVFEATHSFEPAGEPWEEDDLETLFPALCEKFG
jgi:hypothetical protein